MHAKLLMVLFLTILLSFFAVSIVPTAHALTPRTDFGNRHTSASVGYSIVCGDHICAPGEHYKWAGKISQSQHKGHGKVGSTNSGVIWHDICGGVRC